MDRQPALRGNADRGVNRRHRYLGIHNRVPEDEYPTEKRSGARTRFGGPHSRRRQSSGSTSRASNKRARPVKRLRYRGGGSRTPPRPGSSGFVTQAEDLAAGTSSPSHFVETSPAKCPAVAKSTASLIRKRDRKEFEPKMSRPRLEPQYQGSFGQPDSEESSESSEELQQSEPKNAINTSSEDKDALFLRLLKKESESDSDSFNDIEDAWSTSPNLSSDENHGNPC